MSGVDPGDIVELTTIAEYNGSEDIMNVYAFERTSGFSVDDESFIEDMKELAEAIILIAKGLVTVAVVFNRIRIRNLTQDVSLGEVSLAAPIDGTATGSSLPSGVAGLLVFSTTKPKCIGKKYFGPPSEDQLSAPGLFTTGFTDGLVDLGDLLLDPIVVTNGGYQYVVVSTTTPFLAQLPTSARVTNVPAYQRRRKIGRGS